MSGNKPRTSGYRRPSFTLVELLVVMVIIALVSTFVLQAMAIVRDTAKASRTRATIAKIDKVIMAQWESYQTRRVPIDAVLLAQTLYSSQYTSNPVAAVARARLNALRDLIRMEMPDRWYDVAGDFSAFGSPALILTTGNGSDAPAASYRFRAMLQAAYMAASAASRTIMQLHDSEKCLYMIVMNDPESAGMFTEDESADLDNDGLRMFIDGWGRPIKFIRWPAGFLPYDANYWNYGGSSAWGGDTDVQTNVPVTYGSALNASTNPYKIVDPFNPLKVNASNTAAMGYGLYPLVYSAGPNGQYDIYQGGKDTNGISTKYGLTSNGSAGGSDLDPYAKLGNYTVGQPEPLDASLNVSTTAGMAPGHLDNIHNHRLELH